MLQLTPGSYVKSTTLDWEGMVMRVEGDEAEVAFLVPTGVGGSGTFYVHTESGDSHLVEIDERRVTLGTLRLAALPERLRLSLAVLGGTEDAQGLDVRQEMILGVWKPYRHGDTREISRDEASLHAQVFLYSVLAPLLPDSQ